MQAETLEIHASKDSTNTCKQRQYKYMQAKTIQIHASKDNTNKYMQAKTNTRKQRQ